jgi:hypothetical protein
MSQSVLANQQIVERADARRQTQTALQRFRDGMTDGRSNLSDFTAIQRVRGDLPDAVQSALQSGHGEKARLLRGVLRQVDRTMENSSEGFLAANRNFFQAPRDIESIQAGREATTRGRSEDIIPAYQALRPQGQAAFCARYVEPLIAQTQGSAPGVKLARCSMTRSATKAAAMAPGNDD